MSDLDDPKRIWADENHPLRAGMLLGYFMKRDIELEVVMDGEDYTPFVDITISDIVNAAGEALVVRIEVLPGDRR